MVARSEDRSPIPTSDDGGVQRPVVNRRQLMVRVGSWMKYSWRKSKDSLMDGVDEEEEDKRNENGTEEERGEGTHKVIKHVHFSCNDDNGDSNDDVDQDEVITEIINDDENDAPPFFWEEEAKDIWYQTFDFQRFEKDRVLTSMDYTNARRLNKAFVEDEHSVRGIEHLCDESLQRRQTGERKDLYKALKAEEARQKQEGSYPDMEKFRAISLKHTKPGRERAVTKANEDAREQLREMRRSASMKNLFRRQRGRSTSRARRRQSIG